MAYRGVICDTIADYELKQGVIAQIENIKGRYAGRVFNGVTFPDVTLKNGKYFIPYLNGLDTIEKEDIHEYE